MDVQKNVVNVVKLLLKQNQIKNQRIKGVDFIGHVVVKKVNMVMRMMLIYVVIKYAMVVMENGAIQKDAVYWKIMTLSHRNK